MSLALHALQADGGFSDAAVAGRDAASSGEQGIEHPGLWQGNPVQSGNDIMTATRHTRAQTDARKTAMAF